jgi:hypothetical protein
VLVNDLSILSMLVAQLLTKFIVTRAAVIHGYIGNVAAGSTFAILQSAGAGGIGLVIVNGVVQVGAVIALGSGIAASVVETIKQKKAIKEKVC